MKNIIVAVFLCVASSLAIAADTECEFVSGEFKIWNGWQPSLRLADAKSGNIYGVTEDRILPSTMLNRIKKNKPIVGKFCLSILGSVTTVPYQEQSIILVDVIRYEPGN